MKLNRFILFIITLSININLYSKTLLFKNKKKNEKGLNYMRPVNA